MSDEETHEESEEIVFKEDAPAVTESPQMVTKGELNEIIEGWKVKFHQLSEGMRAIQKASCAASENFHTRMDELQKDSCARDEKFHTHMDDLQRDSCACDGAQERRIIEMRSHTPGSGAPLRFAMRASDEHALHAVQTLISSLPSTSPRQRNQRATTEISATTGIITTTETQEITAPTNVPCMTTTEVIAATPSAAPTTVV